MGAVDLRMAAPADKEMRTRDQPGVRKSPLEIEFLYPDSRAQHRNFPLMNDRDQGDH